MSDLDNPGGNPGAEGGAQGGAGGQGAGAQGGAGGEGGNGGAGGPRGNNPLAGGSNPGAEGGAGGGAEGGGAGGGEGGAGAQGGAAGGADVPESYEFHLPEGLTMSDEVAKEFTGIAHELKLSQAQADKLVALHSGVMTKMLGEVNARLDGWAAESEKQGFFKAENTDAIKKTLNTFWGSKGLDALIETGAVHHPDVLAGLLKIGQLLTEDKPPQGEGGGGAPFNPAGSLFPNSHPKR